MNNIFVLLGIERKNLSAFMPNANRLVVGIPLNMKSVFREFASGIPDCRLRIFLNLFCSLREVDAESSRAFFIIRLHDPLIFPVFFIEFGLECGRKTFCAVKSHRRLKTGKHLGFLQFILRLFWRDRNEVTLAFWRIDVRGNDRHSFFAVFGIVNR